MAKLEVFQNGNWSTGEPVYQIGIKNSDGTYETVVFDLMTKPEAEKVLKEKGKELEVVRTRSENGTFVKDNPDTKENEAWEVKKKAPAKKKSPAKKPIVKKAPAKKKVAKKK
tara:strand:- start:453 stop:788 length:336 start_codon:yes stop_codon:yes gene_type:complete